MSSFRKTNVKCPVCGTEGDYTIWDSINVELNPELKPMIMDGSLFLWECPECKEQYYLPYYFLYNDPIHRFMTPFDNTKIELGVFVERIRILENQLDVSSLMLIRAMFRITHKEPELDICFDKLDNDKNLLFSVYEKSEDAWKLTERKHILAYDEYVKIYDERKEKQEESRPLKAYGTQISFFQRMKRFVNNAIGELFSAAD